MAKRKATRRARPAKKAGKTRKPAKKAPVRRASGRASAKKRARAKKPAAKAAKRVASAKGVAAGKRPRLDRARRTLEETVPTPPSSLNMNRKASAARTGRAEMAQADRLHRGMPHDIGGGDVDVDVEDAYFTGDEAPGGDNPTPDQDVVDDIGKALGVQYDDAEELKSSDKISERDKHRWEWDPASSEDYKDRR